MSDVEFTGAELKNVIFKKCNLNGAQFSQAKLKHISLKSSQIEKIHIDKESFNELTVDTAQAIYLASLLGLRIED